MAIRTVSEYARTHGITERTVRRRIRQGQIPARRVDGPYGPEYHILDPDEPCNPGADTLSDAVTASLADDPPLAPVPNRHPSRTSPPPSSALPDNGPDALVHALTLADRLSRENLELAGRVGWLQAELQQTRARVQDLEQEVRLLRAPAAEPATTTGKADDSASAPTSNPPAPEQNEPVRGAECPPRRPWWKFWV